MYIGGFGRRKHTRALILPDPFIHLPVGILLGRAKLEAIMSQAACGLLDAMCLNLRVPLAWTKWKVKERKEDAQLMCSSNYWTRAPGRQTSGLA